MLLFLATFVRICFMAQGGHVETTKKTVIADASMTS